MTSSSLSGDCPLLPDFRDLLSACCNALSARTDLSTLSPTRTFNASFFSLMAHIRFSDASFPISRTIKPPLCLLLALLFLSWVLGSRPWLFFFHGSLGPVPGCFSSLHVRVARVSSNLPLAFWLTASLAVLSSVSRHTSRDSFFLEARHMKCKGKVIDAECEHWSVENATKQKRSNLEILAT